ncbi:hypothetical protein [Actinophytocola gossypii]|uniref:Secreted protein n=1 Tax=Actinophytocola gossypii TaxID=2812003 RepID=A0ABT2JE89_9PSEU|nr:hypothetical protein [Actinophytocola gossypii]MCT2586191.1 hypothetical protein [Actinophytocola gossypii]
MKKRFAAAIAGVVLALSPLATGTASAAEGVGAAASCYGGAESWSARVSWATAGDRIGIAPRRTTSRCDDVNLRITTWGRSYVYARVCFYPTSGNDYCNSWKRYEKTSAWLTPATDVLDGTRVEVFLRHGVGGGYFGYRGEFAI